MAVHFNQKSNLLGNVPLGSFNAMFNLSGSWQLDQASTKSLAVVGSVIPLYTVELTNLDLVLHEDIKRAVPYSWDPASLARYFALYCHFVKLVFQMQCHSNQYASVHRSSVGNRKNRVGESEDFVCVLDQGWHNIVL